jgi:hypothetical protein
MDRLRAWIDRLIERLCEWLDDMLPGHGRLAFVGTALVGGPGLLTLPVDRQFGANALLMSFERDAGFTGVGDTPGNNLDRNCGFWAYCHISGQPCVRCGGKNWVLSGAPPVMQRDSKRIAKFWCPKGKEGGTSWYGCCRNPKGVPKMIAFFDCCGKGNCSPAQWCHKWPDAKNWCYGSSSSTSEYYCTIVYDMDQDDDCAD